MLDRRTVTFVGPCQAEVRCETLPAPPPGQMLVKTKVSAISSGTEMLVYRGQFPGGLPLRYKGISITRCATAMPRSAL